MKKLLIGVAAVVVLAVAGTFAASLWAQNRAEREVAATFEMVRAAGGTATYGKVDFDLWRRTLTVADIAVQPAGASQSALKAARIVATGVGQPAAGHMSAQRIEISDFAAEATMSAPAGIQMSYRAPSIALDGYSGPAAPLRRVDASSTFDISRLVIEQFVATTAAAIMIPSLTTTFTPGKAQGATQMPPIDYVYSDVAIREVRGGRIGSATIGKTSFKSKGTGQISGELDGFAASEIDVGATLALFDPARAKDDRALRIYRQVTVGAYTASLDGGMRMRVDGMLLDDMGIVPSKLPVADIMALVELAPAPGNQPSPAAMRAILDGVATLYEGMSIGKFEMRGVSMTMPDGDFRLGALRLNGLAQGKLAEFAFEGFDSETKQKQPVKVGRFALKGLDIANLLRVSAQFDQLAQQPNPDRVLELLKLLEGAELKELVAPYEQSNKPVQIETLTISWGQYAGPMPTQVRLSAKMSGPIDMTDQEPFQMLAAMGFTSATINLDLGTDWTEGTRVFAIAPATFEIANLFATSASVSLGNVAKDVFSLDPVKVMQAAAGIEAGPVEISLRDTGGLDLAIRQYAEAKSLSRSAAQAELIDELNQSATVLTQASPELAPVFAAAAKFLEAPRGTLTVKITPNGRVGLLELMALSPEEALTALSRFTVEASVK